MTEGAEPTDSKASESAPASPTGLASAPSEAARAPVASASPPEPGPLAAPTAPGASPPAVSLSALEDALARSDREAAEALATGAFDRGFDTVRIAVPIVPLAALATPVAEPKATPASEAPAAATPASPPVAAPPPEPSPAAPSVSAAAAPEAPAPAAPESPVAESPAPISAVGASAGGAAESPAPATSAPAVAEASAAAPAAPASPTPDSPAPASTAPSAPAGVEATATPAVVSPAPVAATTAQETPAGTIAVFVTEPALDQAPTEKFDRRTVGAVGAVHADGARPTAPVAAEPKRDAAKSSATIKARSEEDDRLVGALIFLDPPAAGPERPPSPFATIAGVSLLKRAAAAAKAAGVPRVVLAGMFEPETHFKAVAEFAKAGYTGPLQTWTAEMAMPFGERGRVLILDAAGVHDPEAVARLARWRGERACVLLAEEGDGLRVQVEGGKVLEVGSSLVPFDGVTCGAVNVPIPLFARLTELGALGALLSLARDGMLAATLERRTFAREITSETSLGEARQRLLDRASGGPGDAILNRVIHRKLSRPLTGMLLPMGVPPMLLTVGSGIVGLLGAALLSGCGLPPSPIILWIGVLLLFGSIVIDCAGDELAALGMRDSATRRFVGLVLDGVVSTAAVFGLGVGAKLLHIADGMTLGLYAAVGVALGSLLSIATGGGDASTSTDTVTRGVDLLAARVRNRDITYVILLVVLAHTIQQVVQGNQPENPEGPPVLWLSLVILPALCHAYWVALAVLVAAKPRASS